MAEATFDFKNALAKVGKKPALWIGGAVALVLVLSMFRRPAENELETQSRALGVGSGATGPDVASIREEYDKKLEALTEQYEGRTAELEAQTNTAIQNQKNYYEDLLTDQAADFASELKGLTESYKDVLEQSKELQGKYNELANSMTKASGGWDTGGTSGGTDANGLKKWTAADANYGKGPAGPKLDQKTELERTNQIIADMKKKGMDTTLQENWKKRVESGNY